MFLSPCCFHCKQGEQQGEKGQCFFCLQKERLL